MMQVDPRREAALRTLEELAQSRRLVELANNTEVQLRQPEDWTPLLAILSRAQDEAADAMSRLVTAPADRADVVRGLQTQIWRYESLVRWLREIIVEGNEAQERIATHRADYLRELVLDVEDDETRKALGLAEVRAPSE